MLPWQSVDTQADLDALHDSVCWEDSETVEYYVTHVALPDFPPDINRSGYRLPNVYVLLDACSQRGPWLEMVWIHADRFDSQFAQYPFIRGRVDSLMRVEISDYTKALRLRCGRLIYRFRDDLTDVPVCHFAQLFHSYESRNG